MDILLAFFAAFFVSLLIGFAVTFGVIFILLSEAQAKVLGILAFALVLTLIVIA